ncbi:uncharacterized protein LOC144078953 isoform X3 [Stigmatopora argus]
MDGRTAWTDRGIKRTFGQGRTDGMDGRTAWTNGRHGRHGRTDGMDRRTAWTGGRHGRADGMDGRTDGRDGPRDQGVTELLTFIRDNCAWSTGTCKLGVLRPCCWFTRIWSLSGGGAIYPSQQIANEPAMSPRTSRDHRDLLGW